MRFRDSFPEHIPWIDFARGLFYNLPMHTSNSLTSLSIASAGELLAAGEISPVELTQAHLERIQQLDPQLNCFITLTHELALQQARQAEQEIRTGKYLGPLHGIPLALKDLFETEGVRTTAGSSFFAENVPDQDACVVSRLREAGMVLLGKLNLHEIALGVTNENPHYGATCNPWDLRCIPGGSSGGSAAALAAGLCLGSLGTDTGGSIRIPAALCGVVGLKPTRGRVSLRGVIPLSWNLDHVGPMARSVQDVALLLGVIAGYDPEDPWSIDQPVEDYQVELTNGVRGWRVALAMDEYFTDPQVVDAQVWQSIQKAARVFEQLGAHVDEVEFPGARQAAQMNGLMTPSDGAAFHRDRLQTNPDGFGADVLFRLRTGAAYNSTEYSLARQKQDILRRQFYRFFDEYDLLLTPTVPISAPVRGSADAVARARLLTRFTAPFNLTGLPALSVPCGLTREGLPVGLQLVTRPWAEARLLRAGWAFENYQEEHGTAVVYPPIPVRGG
jgi:aspartyl-tRNA(Asn)/glutamyl-tRNA(Gln) amidotransferase subunit A